MRRSMGTNMLTAATALLVLLAVTVVRANVEMPQMTDPEWQQVYEELSVCTTGVFNLCSVRRGSHDDISYHPISRSRAQCEQQGGAWQDRYSNWQSWRAASLLTRPYSQTAASDTTAAAAAAFPMVVKFDGRMEVNVVTRSTMPAWLRMANLLPCRSTAPFSMYAFAHGTALEAAEAVDAGLLSLAFAQPTEAKLAPELMSALYHDSIVAPTSSSTDAINNHDDKKDNLANPQQAAPPPVLVTTVPPSSPHRKTTAHHLQAHFLNLLQPFHTNNDNNDNNDNNPGNDNNKQSSGSSSGTISVSPASDTVLTIHGVAPHLLHKAASTLAEDKDCVHVDILPVHRLSNYDAQTVSQSGTVSSAADPKRPFWAAGIKGQGQVVGVADSGLDYGSCYFRDAARPVTVSTGSTFNDANHRKIAQYVAYADNSEGESGGHGTHVCGSVGGNEANGGSTPNEFGTSQYAGAAPDAKLAFFDIGVPDSGGFLQVPPALENNMFPPAYTAGARIHTNSWGSSSNSYSSNAVSVDQYMFDNQDFLVLFAAGNSGNRNTCAPDGSIGTPATSKNTIAVGASRNGPSNQNNLASFSSTGPRSDNAFGIDLLSPGSVITSAGSASSGQTCQTVGMQGTSMATPLLAGHAALVRQYLMDGYYPTGTPKTSNAFTPMSALVKALLINGAHVLTGSCGDTSPALESQAPAKHRQMGFGLVQLDRSMVIPNGGPLATVNMFVDGNFDSMRAFTTAADPKQTYEFELVDAPQGQAKPFLATLVWNDPPASTNAATLLMNDLDLYVECTANCGSGQTIYGSNSNDQVTIDASGNVVGGDTLENAEKVIIGSPPAGATLLVTVKAKSVPSGPQPFAVAVSGEWKVASDGLPTTIDINGNARTNPDVEELTMISLSVFIVLGAGMLLYVGSAVSVEKYNKDRIGMPKSHSQFWCAVPGLVADGIMLTTTCVMFVLATLAYGMKLLVSKCRGGGSAVIKPSTKKQPKAVKGAQDNRAMNRTAAPARRPSPRKPSFQAQMNRQSFRQSGRYGAKPIPVMSDWTRHTDPNSGQPYWFNPKTGQSSWTDPSIKPRV